MKRTFFLILFSGTLYIANSQELSGTNNDTAIQMVIKDYFQKTHSFVTIYSGKEQVKYPLYIIGHPYLNSDSYEKGLLLYDGILYENVPLRLDLYQNELIIQSPDTRFNIILDSDKIDYANLYNYKVIYHNKKENGSPLDNGYYLQLPTGKYKVWRKTTSTLKETVNENITVQFVQRSKYYFLKGEQAYQINGQNSILRLFPSLKKELKHYIKQNRLNFRKNPEDFLLNVTHQIEILE